MRQLVGAAAPLVAMLVAVLGPAPAGAASIVGVSPQGEVAQVRQVTVRFSAAVVPFGDSRLPDPMRLACTGGSAAGDGRWTSDRHWVYDLREPLPPGTRCTLTRDPAWQPRDGALTGRSEFSFHTGGPAVVSIEPYPGARIEEDQHFLLRLNGPPTEASVAANAWCEVDGIGERLPVRIVGGPARDAVLKARRLQKDAARALLLACPRPLPAKTAMRLVWGKGIAASADPKLLTGTAQVYRYEVRPPFLAEFSCERERAGAPCVPVLPMSLSFGAPVPRSQAAQVRLRAPDGRALAPVFDKDDKAEEVQTLRFSTPLAEEAAFQVELPAGLTDNAGRALANASAFPLAVRTGAAPPIAKFAAAPFGIIEWQPDAMLPITLRHVQGELRPGGAGRIRVLPVREDAEIQQWQARLRQLDGDYEKRNLSLLREQVGARATDLPQLQGGDPRPFEVVGLPLPEPGYHVVEIESPRLGASLLDKPAPMYVRTAVLVTNLGVHVKRGRENSLVWVSTLDRARPVEGAQVAIGDCQGRTLWSGRTDAQGLARVAQRLEPGPQCEDEPALFVSARKADAKGVVDTAFASSDWQRGIEPWRFNLPTSAEPGADVRAHTVLDRSLLRAGETVSMKHFVRSETLAGLAPLPPEALPTRVKLTHQGSGQELTLPLQWQGVRSATSRWNIPAAARLGVWEIALERVRGGAGGDASGADAVSARWPSGLLRVEEFRVPLLDARLAAPKEVPIAPKALDFALQLQHLSGGPVKQAPVQASAVWRERAVQFPDLEDFSFQPPRETTRGDAAQTDDEGDTSRAGRLIADKLALTTDANGAAMLALKDLPPVDRPVELMAEASFRDPNGEVQTIGTRVPLWPAAVVAGIRAASWASARGAASFTALALDTAGRPLAGQALEVRGRTHQVISSRKRMVGGFYAYDNRVETRELGLLCSGKSDAQGRLACSATLDQAGEVELVVQAADAQGRIARAATRIWVTRQGELWFAQDNDDRIDVLPEKKAYEPGETARLQVRTPYRDAQALVTIEREGIVDARLVRLRGDDPTLELKIDPAWGPNVYVGVLALRGRIRDVPWTSFFRWGWKEPLEWWRAFIHENREYQAPTAMVDLSRPSFKFGVAALRVGLAPHALQVRVSPERAQYQVREKAVVRVQVQHGGKPAAGAELAFAAVDEGLLALRGNESWDLLHAMLRERPWGVETATGHHEIIGRRHYGRKALPAGGGGGRGATRELFDTLLLWQPRVALDANGEARIEVPLNDSLTSFRLVAIADDDTGGAPRFGTGAASIRVTQDLQMLAGLPPLVREGDRYDAMLTLRNTTAREMRLRATLNGSVHGGGPGETVRTPLPLPPQELVLPAGGAQELRWSVQVPADATSIVWEGAVQELARASGTAAGAGAGPGPAASAGAPSGAASDRLKFTQLVAPAVPLQVVQATLQPLDAPLSLPIAAPADAQARPGADVPRGGVQLALRPSLAGTLPGLRRYFENYPFVCLEQKASKAIGLGDAALWTRVVDELPAYLDADGLAGFFPMRVDEAARGSDRLTAHLIAAAHEAGFELPAPQRDAMLAGLAAFVEGRIERRGWAPGAARGADRDVRKLAAIEALSRHGRATARMLGSVNVAPNLWPTAAVIDWLRILRRIDGVPSQAERRKEAEQVLRSRLTWGGTTLKFSNEEGDFWWWLMDSADANAGRLILAVLDDAAWRDELPRLVVGHLGRQRGGAWLTTTANLWGSLALRKFAAAFEATPVSGRTEATLGAQRAAHDWSQARDGATLPLAWPAGGGGTLEVAQRGDGRPWLSVQALAAVPLTAPRRAGYAVSRSVTAVQRQDPSRWSRGDVLRVRIEVDAQTDMSWVVVSDPVPAGATVLGSGLGRDSAIATRGERQEGQAWPAYVERSFEAYRGYYEFMPRGRHVIEYSVRLNNPGRFMLPPTRVEAMYAPETHGELPNSPIEVGP